MSALDANELAMRLMEAEMMDDKKEVERLKLLVQQASVGGVRQSEAKPGVQARALGRGGAEGSSVVRVALDGVSCGLEVKRWTRKVY